MPPIKRKLNGLTTVGLLVTAALTAILVVRLLRVFALDPVRHLRRPSQFARPVAPPAPGSPSASALREACRSRGQAERRVSQELDQLEAWDPEAHFADDRVKWHQRLMARDEGGLLKDARAAATWAAALARTPAERYEATQVLVEIEHDLGDHRAELKEARLLARRAPRNPEALAILVRAARCNGLESFARRMDAARARLLHGAASSPYAAHHSEGSGPPQRAGRR